MIKRGDLKNVRQVNKIKMKAKIIMSKLLNKLLKSLLLELKTKLRNGKLLILIYTQGIELDSPMVGFVSNHFSLYTMNQEMYGHTYSEPLAFYGLESISIFLCNHLL